MDLTCLLATPPGGKEVGGKQARRVSESDDMCGCDYGFHCKFKNSTNLSLCEPIQECRHEECSALFHKKCVKAAFAEPMTQQGLVDMDECNMDNCDRHCDDNSDHCDVRGREKTKQNRIENRIEYVLLTTYSILAENRIEYVLLTT